MKRALLILGSGILFWALLNFALNRVEKKWSQPTNFSLDLPNGKIPEEICRKYKIHPQTKIAQCVLVGTFNDWGSKQSLDYLLEGQEGYPLKEVAPVRWEVKVKLPPGEYLYKFRFRLDSQNSKEWIWTDDWQNPQKSDDRFGGFNSILKVKSLKKFQSVFNILMASLLLIFLSRYLIERFVKKVMMLEINLTRKFLVMASAFVLVMGTILLAVLFIEAGTLLRIADTQTANFLYNAAHQPIIEALRSGATQPPDSKNPLWQMTLNLMDNQSPETYSLRDVDITWAVLYDALGKPRLMGASENNTLWQKFHPQERQRFLDKIYSEKNFLKNLNGDLTYAYLDPSTFDLSVNDFASWIKKAAGTIHLIFKSRKIFPYNSFFYKIRSARKTYGTLFIFSFRNLKAWQMLHIFKSASYSLFLAAILGLILIVVCIRILLMPMFTLMKQMERVETGEFNSRVYFKTSDEIGRLGRAFNRMTESLKEKELIKETFGRYVSPQIAQKILKEIDSIKLGGEKKQVTILFADIRNFTPFAEKNQPEEVLAILNEYFSCMIDSIFEFEGTLDKFIGDCVMGVFGAPLSQADHARRACECGLKIHENLAQLKNQREQEGKITLEVGIGIHTGFVVAGNLGNEKRTEFSVIGDAVNLAYRLKDLARGGEILTTQETLKNLSNQIKFRSVGTQKIKGKAEPIEIFEIVSEQHPASPSD